MRNVHICTPNFEFEAMDKNRRQGVYEHIAWEHDVKIEGVAGVHINRNLERLRTNLKRVSIIKIKGVQ